MILEALKYLLTKNDCVILPEFGGFIAQMHTSSLHPIRNSITPPSKRIVFNSALSGNDGLLQSYLTSELKLTAVEATEKIKSYVKSLFNQLNTDTRVNLDGLGVFSLNAEKKLVFTPISNQDNFLQESFGLPTLYIKPLEKSSFMETAEKRDLQNSNEEKTPNKSKRYLLIPVILVLIGVAVAIFMTNNTHPIQHEQASILSSTDSMESDSVIEDIDEEEVLGDVQVEEASVYDESSASSWSSEEVSTSTHSSGPYFIIAGVFSHQKYADKFVAQHNGTHTMEVNGLYKVSIASYGNVNDALQALPELRSEYGSEVWIMKHH